ncbi:MAG: hypothetical protein GY869_05330 [Planctomycetes bacterium]|nr:hypothetical protein [Planctomycetota bacterium]
MTIWKVRGAIVDGPPDAAIRALYLFDEDGFPTIPPPLKEMQVWAVSEIKSQAETQRSQYITNLPGKIGEYRQKEAEYQRWQVKKSARPNPAQYPIAAAESAVYGIKIAEMLQVWGERAVAWAQAAAQIAAIERRALLGVEAATDEAGLVEVLAGMEW